MAYNNIEKKREIAQYVLDHGPRAACERYGGVSYSMASSWSNQLKSRTGIFRDIPHDKDSIPPKRAGAFKVTATIPFDMGNGDILDPKGINLNKLAGKQLENTTTEEIPMETMERGHYALNEVDNSGVKEKSFHSIKAQGDELVRDSLREQATHWKSQYEQLKEKYQHALMVLGAKTIELELLRDGTSEVRTCGG